MTRANAAIDQHPDIAELRARYDRVAETSTAQSVDGLTVLAGTFLAISPWVIGFLPGEGDLAANNLFTGLIVAVLGFGFATAYGRTHGLSWVLSAIGIWTIVAPWVIQGGYVAGGTVLTNVLVGAIITICGFMTMAMGGRRRGTRAAH